jgi:inhibitor of KinA
VAGVGSSAVPALPDIRPLGDQAFLVRFGATISPELHAAVRSTLSALDGDRPAWVVDLVPAYASVLVVYDPVRVEPDEVTAWLGQRVTAGPAAVPAARRVTVPVWYEAQVAPYLETVAQEKGLTVERLIALHTGLEVLVYMLGFRPGFPYMGTTDERLAVERLATPRLAVPAGSVALAGRQTGIYPVASPGGWRIIGRTPWRLFDPARSEPFRLLPGDLVRFEAIDERRFRELEEASQR